MQRNGKTTHHRIAGSNRKAGFLVPKIHGADQNRRIWVSHDHTVCTKRNRHVAFRPLTKSGREFDDAFVRRRAVERFEFH